MVRGSPHVRHGPCCAFAETGSRRRPGARPRASGAASLRRLVHRSHARADRARRRGAGEARAHLFADREPLVRELEGRADDAHPGVRRRPERRAEGASPGGLLRRAGLHHRAPGSRRARRRRAHHPRHAHGCRARRALRAGDLLVHDGRSGRARALGATRGTARRGLPRAHSRRNAGARVEHLGRRRGGLLGAASVRRRARGRDAARRGGAHARGGAPMKDAMSAFAPAPAFASSGPSTMTPVKWGLLAGLVALGALWGAFVAFQGMSAALICIAAIVFVFTIPDFRVGVLVMILIMPISWSYMFPRAMFGVPGLNPLNVLLVGPFLSYILVAMPEGSIKRLMPWWGLPVFVLPIVLAGVNGMGHVKLIPPAFFDTEQIDFKNDFGYVRDAVVKPLILVAYSLIVGAAYARAREPHKFMVPMMVSMWLMGFMVIGYFLHSNVKFGQLAGEYARHFLSPLGMHANDLGRLYVTAIAILLFTWDRTRRPVLKTLPFLSIGLIGIALVLTFSRNAFMTVALVIAIYLVSRRRNRKLLALAAVLIPLVVAFTS